jgi:S-adenosylmethionine:tRNA ribosyltransferase-isomerase
VRYLRSIQPLSGNQLIYQLININDYSYNLPEERIALHPLPVRDQSKLLVYKNGTINHAVFSELANFVPANSILLFNNTKVIPARLIFKKDTGAAIEIFLLDPVWPTPIVAIAMSAKQKSRWHCTVGNAKRWREHSPLKITRGDLTVEATLVDKAKSTVEFNWNTPATFSEVVQHLGAVPLPPYIKRKAETSDFERYQTVYSKHDGAVAAPTAGLHFTESTFNSLKSRGISIDYLTLHVSSGTFQPVKVLDATEHPMHEEQIIVARRNVETLLSEKTLVAVGTTSLRTMESIYWYGVKLLANPSADFLITQQDAYQLKPLEKLKALKAVLGKMDSENTDQLVGKSSIYILPGYDFKTTDALITNFHQPGSTLMLLVAAFVGHDWRKIYDEALTGDYRFLSYGDSSLLFRLT